MCSGLKTRSARWVDALLVEHGVSEKGETLFVTFEAVLTCATKTCVVGCIVGLVGGILITLLNALRIMLGYMII
jgi:hypothetical protein